MTAQLVLGESILDIKAGHWLCGEIMQAAEANGNKKPDGCAVGLAVINAKLAPIVIEEDTTGQFESGLYAYCPIILNPSEYFKGDGEYTQAQLKALEKSIMALALAIPMDFRDVTTIEHTGADGESYWEDIPLSNDEIKDFSINQLEKIVIEYNDSSINAHEAEQWFQAAYDSVKS
jgi:hypothetical protein